MERLAPPLECILELQSALQNGETVRVGLHRYAQRGGGEFESAVRRFLFAWDQGHDWRAEIGSLKSPVRRALLEIAAQGMSGQPVSERLADLAKEAVALCEDEIRRHLDLLPLKMLAPLLLFQFPAFLLLLFGPLVSRFLAELSR